MKKWHLLLLDMIIQDGFDNVQDWPDILTKTTTLLPT
jgi:hypothetical protein